MSTPENQTPDYENMSMAEMLADLNKNETPEQNDISKSTNEEIQSTQDYTNMSMAEMLADLNAQEKTVQKESTQEPKSKAPKKSRKGLIAVTAAAAIAAGAVYDNTQNDSKYTDQLLVKLGNKTALSGSIKSLSSIPPALQGIAYVTLTNKVPSYKNTGVKDGEIAANDTKYFIAMDTVFKAGDNYLLRVGKKFIPFNLATFDVVNKEELFAIGDAFDGITSIEFAKGSYVYDYIYDVESNSVIKASKKINVTIDATNVGTEKLVRINNKNYFASKESSSNATIYIEAKEGTPTFETLTAEMVPQLKNMSQEAQTGLIRQVLKDGQKSSEYKAIFTALSKENLLTIMSVVTELSEKEVQTFFNRSQTGLSIYGKNVSVQSDSIVAALGKKYKGLTLTFKNDKTVTLSGASLANDTSIANTSLLNTDLISVKQLQENKDAENIQRMEVMRVQLKDLNKTYPTMNYEMDMLAMTYTVSLENEVVTTSSIHPFNINDLTTLIQFKKTSIANEKKQAQLQQAQTAQETIAEKEKQAAIALNVELKTRNRKNSDQWKIEGTEIVLTEAYQASLNSLNTMIAEDNQPTAEDVVFNSQAEVTEIKNTYIQLTGALPKSVKRIQNIVFDSDDFKNEGILNSIENLQVQTLTEDGHEKGKDGKFGPSSTWTGKTFILKGNDSDYLTIQKRGGWSRFTEKAVQ